MNENFLDAVESYAMLRLLLTQEPHIADLSRPELVGGAPLAEARKAEVLVAVEADREVLLDELVSLLPHGDRRAALQLLDRVLDHIEAYWPKASTACWDPSCLPKA